MTVYPVNQGVSAVAKFVHEAEEVCSNALTKVSGVATRFFTIGNEALSSPSGLALVMTVAAIGIGYYLYVHPRRNLPQSAREFVDQTRTFLENDDVKEIRDSAYSFVENIFCFSEFRDSLRIAGCDERLRVFVRDKLTQIIRGEAHRESKIEIIDTVIHNLIVLVSAAQKRAENDMKAGILACFGIEQSDKIVGIYPLGDETHHEGKIPLCIIYESGKMIVYKPRSMLAEKLICDSEIGILKEEGFGTYKVVCQIDESGQRYGYSDFLVNREDQNTVLTLEAVREYIRKMCVLEKVSQGLGLADLHYMNIITDHLEPRIVDAEVFLSPLHVQSGIFDPETGAMKMFDLMRGTDRKLSGKNRIWFDPSLTSGTDCDFRFQMSEGDLAKIGVHVEEIMRSTQLFPGTQNKILDARRILQEQNGRFVLKETIEFIRMQSGLDHRNISSFTPFMQAIREWINEEGFLFDEKAVEIIRAGIVTDVRNHDIPVFYYDSRRETILYNGAVIGYKASQETVPA